jgi:hypothetical protein
MSGMDGLLDRLAEQHPVRQLGQRIVTGQMRRVGLGLAAFGDLFEGGEPALLHSLMRYRERAPVAQFPGVG